MKKIWLIPVLLGIVNLNVFLWQSTKKPVVVVKPRTFESHVSIIPARPEPKTIPSNITAEVYGYQSYSEIVSKLNEWHQKAPHLTEVGTYGESSKGHDLHFIRITNLAIQEDKPKVLITSCVHGNEPLATSTTMSQFSALLSGYGKDDRITKLLDTRDIYLVPVVSPDSYPFSRHVDGVDPNRNYPTIKDPNKKSVPPVEALKQFHLKHHFNAVISGHTWGRWYLIPYGYKHDPTPNDKDYQEIVGEMARMSGYKLLQASKLYPIGSSGGRRQPIWGGDMDWFYFNGAFTIVCEFGDHQRKPTQAETEREFKKTNGAFLLFLEKAPLVKILK